MPTRAPLGCTAPGCPSTRPCADHPRAWHGRKMPPGWAATRARILRRDRYRCRGCGAPATEVHHAVPGCEEDWSLLSVRHQCHQAVTRAQQALTRWAKRGAANTTRNTPRITLPADPCRLGTVTGSSTPRRDAPAQRRYCPWHELTPWPAERTPAPHGR